MFPFLPFIMIAVNAFHYSSDRLNCRRHASVVFRQSSHSWSPNITQTPALSEWAKLSRSDAVLSVLHLSRFSFPSVFFVTSCLFIGWLFVLLSVLLFFSLAYFFFVTKPFLERTWGKDFTFKSASFFSDNLAACHTFLRASAIWWSLFVGVVMSLSRFIFNSLTPAGWGMSVS